MAKIIVYNNDTNRMEIYYRREEEPMPYNTGTLKVGEFKGNSKSNTLWTEKRAMQAWNSFRYLYGKPIYVEHAFKRPYEGGHGQQSQHYAGLAFDVGKNLTNEERDEMRNLAENSGVWSYVKSGYITPTWIHMDKRRGPPACDVGYPQLEKGSIGAYVLVLQDSLNTLGYKTDGLDGIFGNNTANAVIAFQKNKNINEDAIVGCETWEILMQDVVGKGRMATTID